jgi:hypothetical protein
MDLISGIIRVGDKFPAANERDDWRERPGEAITRRRQCRLARKYHQEKMPQVHEMKLNYIGRSFRQARKRQRITAMEAYVYNAQMLEAEKEWNIVLWSITRCNSSPLPSSPFPLSPFPPSPLPPSPLTAPTVHDIDNDALSTFSPPWSPMYSRLLQFSMPDTDVMFMQFRFCPGNPESRFDGGISGPVISMCNTSSKVLFFNFCGLEERYDYAHAVETTTIAAQMLSSATPSTSPTWRPFLSRRC